MPHSAAVRRFRGTTASRPKKRAAKESRVTVALDREAIQRVEQYAEMVDASMSKAIAVLVRLGLDSLEDRKREFFRRLKQNLGEDDPKQHDRLVDEFRTLILGR